jgi:hypothetical protein
VSQEENSSDPALTNGSADVALIVGGSDAPSVAKLLTNPKLGLMNFSTAEALTRMFPDLVRLVFHRMDCLLDQILSRRDPTIALHRTA